MNRLIALLLCVGLAACVASSGSSTPSASSGSPTPSTINNCGAYIGGYGFCIAACGSSAHSTATAEAMCIPTCNPSSNPGEPPSCNPSPGCESARALAAAEQARNASCMSSCDSMPIECR